MKPCIGGLGVYFPCGLDTFSPSINEHDKLLFVFTYYTFVGFKLV